MAELLVFEGAAPRGPSAEVCELLRDVLAEAERGEVDGIAMALIAPDGTPGRAWCNPDVALLGTVTMLKQDLAGELMAE